MNDKQELLEVLRLQRDVQRATLERVQAEERVILLQRDIDKQKPHEFTNSARWCLRWRLEYSTAQLYLNILQVADTIWNSMPRMQKQQKIQAVDIEARLADDFERQSMREIVIDGHEKVLEDVASILPMLDCVIYDRMCRALAAVPCSELLCGIKHFCVEKFHAYGQASSCPCSPYVHSRIDKRFQHVDTSVAEQTFAWFRNDAGTFNTMARLRYVFYVTFYVQKHIELVRQNSPFGSNKKRFRTRPYGCRKPASAKKILRRPSSKAVLRRPASCTRKRPSSSRVS
ncbi:unnamed protein product [Symbiodinium pilosum]|uniref:Uncharacterized protein n=1 Tax=Symbiodinium pilosum TaxID=2952 RepID=A0A812V511_SYMPI|nr:unnamed protein product [Symbiodinium pilosum]